MKSLVASSLVAASLLVSAEALAYPHLIQAFSHGNSPSPEGADQQFKSPDLSTHAKGEWAYTMGGIDAGGLAETDSDTGSMAADLHWSMPAETPTGPSLYNIDSLQPRCHIEERIAPATKGTKVGVKVTLKFDVSTSFTSKTGASGDTIVTLDIGDCHASYNRSVASTTGEVLADNHSASCPDGSPGKADASASELSIELPDIGEETYIVTEIHALYHGASNAGSTGNAKLRGALSMAVTGGAITAESPSFLKGATESPPPDPMGSSGASSSSSSNGGATSTPGADAGAGPAAAPSDDGGCNTTGTGTASGAGLLALAIAALVSRRRQSGV